MVGQWTRQSVDQSFNWSVGGLVVWVDGRMEGWYFVEFFPPIAYIRMYVVFVGIFFSFFCSVVVIVVLNVIIVVVIVVVFVVVFVVVIVVAI